MSTEPMTQRPTDHDQDEPLVDAASDPVESAQQASPESGPDDGLTDDGLTGGTTDDSLGDEPETDVPDETGSESSALDSADTGRRGTRHEHLEHEGEVAADFLETLLDIADLDGDLEVNVEGDRAAVAIVDSEDGPAPKSLVGRDGAVLEALQELTRLAVQAETGDRSRLMLDVAGHRAGRRAQLVELARATAEQVKDSGERAELEPMSAFERKVVHDEVLAAGLSSESEGTEPNRYVVVLPAH